MNALQIFGYLLKIILIFTACIISFLTVKKNLHISNRRFKTYYEITHHNNNKLKSKPLIFIAVATLLSCAILYIYRPYIYDIPNFITNDVVTFRAVAKDFYHPTRTFKEYVRFNGVDLEIFMTSNLKKGDYCEVSYLPHSNYIIKISRFESNSNLGEFKSIPFPFKQIVLFLILLPVGSIGIALLAYTVKYTKYIIIQAALLISIILNIFKLLKIFFIQGFIGCIDSIFFPLLISSVIFSAFALAIPFVKKLSNDEYDGNMYHGCLQLISLLTLLISISSAFKF